MPNTKDRFSCNWHILLYSITVEFDLLKCLCLLPLDNGDNDDDDDNDADSFGGGVGQDFFGKIISY